MTPDEVVPVERQQAGYAPGRTQPAGDRGPTPDDVMNGRNLGGGRTRDQTAAVSSMSTTPSGENTMDWGFDSTGAETTSGPVGEQAADYETDLVEEYGLNPRDVRVETTQRDGDTYLVPSFSPRAQRQITGQESPNLDASDLTIDSIGEGGRVEFGVTPTGVRNLQPGRGSAGDRGATPDDIVSIDQQTGRGTAGDRGVTPDQVKSINDQLAGYDPTSPPTTDGTAGDRGVTPDQVSSISEQTAGGRPFTAPALGGFRTQPGVRGGDDITDVASTPNAEITDSLTRSNGFLTETQEAGLATWAAGVRERYGEARADQILEDARGVLEPYDVDPMQPDTPDTQTRASKFAEGVFKFPSNLISGAAALPGLAETGVETGQNLPLTVDRFGAVETGRAIGETAGATAVRAGQEFAERPWESVGGLAAEVATGAIAFKAVEKAGDVASSMRVSRKADVVVDEADISNPERVGQTTGTGYPEFSEEAVRDTDVALQEMRDAASEMPTELRETTKADRLLYHGTESEFPDEGTVQAGSRSEVSGQFFAGDLSALRLRSGSGSGGFSLRPRLPRFRDRRNVVMTEPRSIDAVPDRLGGRRVPGEDLDIPDPDAPGGRRRGRVSEYMLDEGGRGEAYIQPRGTRTSEQEAIIPENTPFTQTEVSVGVRLEDGDIIPGRLYRYGDDLGDASGGVDAGDLDVDAGRITMRDELPSSSLSRPEGSPGAGGALSGGVVGVGSRLVEPTSRAPSAPMSPAASPSDLGGSPGGYAGTSSPFGPGSGSGPGGSVGVGPSGTPSGPSVPSGGPTGPFETSGTPTSGGPSGGPSDPFGPGSGSGPSPSLDPYEPTKSRRRPRDENTNRKRDPFEDEMGGDWGTLEFEVYDPFSGGYL